MNNRNIIRIATYFFVLLYLISIVTYIPYSSHTGFNDPDDKGNYLGMKLYSETGKLYYFKDYSILDYENYLHSRGFATFNNRIVPIQYHGLPIIYGTIYIFIKENIDIAMAIILSLLSFIFFIKLSRIIFGSDKYSIISFLSMTPILYYLNNIYFNITITVTFFIMGLYFLIKSLNIEEKAKIKDRNKIKYYMLSSLFFSISILSRNEFGIFISILLVAIIMSRHINKEFIIKYVLITGIFISIFALVPTLILNNDTYGDPLIFPNMMLRNMADEQIGFNNIFENIFPSQIDLGIILKNTDRLFFKFLPLVSLISIIGISYSIKIKRCELNKYSDLYVILILYILIYFGSSNTFNGRNFEYIGFDISIMRYWITIYLFMGLFTVGGLMVIDRINKKIASAVIMVLIVISISTLFVDTEFSLINKLNAINGEKEISIIKNLDNNSIIYSSRLDKGIETVNVDLGTWRRIQYDTNKLSNSIIRVHKNTNYSIYIYRDDKNINIEEIDNILKNENLELKEIGNVPNLYKLMTID